jgi:hypothetical protein
LDGGSARRKTATYTRKYKHRINADRHPCLEWDIMMWPKKNTKTQFMSGAP